MRKPMQLIDYDAGLLVLCDDGTIWLRRGGLTDNWMPRPWWTQIEGLPVSDFPLPAWMGDDGPSAEEMFGPGDYNSDDEMRAHIRSGGRRGETSEERAALTRKANA